MNKRTKSFDTEFIIIFAEYDDLPKCILLYPHSRIDQYEVEVSLRRLGGCDVLYKTEIRRFRAMYSEIKM